jgi:hypothetical protein
MTIANATRNRPMKRLSPVAKSRSAMLHSPV